jgi:hypothetical protein
MTRAERGRSAEREPSAELERRRGVRGRCRLLHIGALLTIHQYLQLTSARPGEQSTSTRPSLPSRAVAGEQGK